MSVEDKIKRIKEALVTRMEGKSYLRPATVIGALEKDTGESAITVRQCLARLARDEWIDGVSSDGTPFRQVRIIGPIPVVMPDPGQERWHAAIDRASGLLAEDKSALIPLWRKLTELDAFELDSVLSGLMALRANLARETGRHRFIVSASYLLGSSKLLDELSSHALRAFGINVNVFPSHPYYVVVAGAREPEAVVLVENPAVLEVAIKTEAAARCAFVATFGFGLGRMKEDYGNQLVDIVVAAFANTVTLTREGSQCPHARELLAHPNISFWGDLDLAGIQIYLQLKKLVPALRLSALYRPMVDAIEAPTRRHRYISAVGNKDGQVKMTVQATDSEVEALLGVCKRFAVDQEIVSATEITKWAGGIFHAA